ncbi:phage tail protein [uncultured Roseovarius sp.]|uniref:phage tail protein n=1 Tax=uncultured Roseovarius sp. TaxID=293344 RepID=UPI000C60447B|nr:phage tail protein [Roseovarius sp.]MBD11540.1 phage tail protein [Roseovarius sp.]|tara:strand:+ start:98 stop:556 length:459 start_codon:yes stop_codon:yes gene_type:complete
MVDDGSAQSQNIWPLPKFYFRVTWDTSELNFQEVSGLDADSQPIEYRAGNSPVFSRVKMPGMLKSGNITMKKGVFSKDNGLFEWFTEIEMNRITLKELTISLMDESGAPTMIWRVKNAFPVKVRGTDLKAEGNEVAIESIEFAHEGLTIENV